MTMSSSTHPAQLHLVHGYQRKARVRLLPHRILAALGALAAPAVPAGAFEAAAAPEPEVATFEASFFGKSGAANVQRFERGNPVLPGDYSVDVYVNDRRVVRENVSFVTSPADGRVRACLTAPLLERAGVDATALAGSAGGDESCIDFASAMPAATVSFDVNALRLDLGIPQVNLRRRPRGYVDPREWDGGITAGTLAYRMNAYRSEFAGRAARHSAYLGLDAGFNTAGWRFRQRSSLRWGVNGSHWQNTATYAEHDLVPWRAQLTLGDAYTSGQLFDAFGFRGARIVSDDRMLPDSLAGYAPTVRGIAESQARVEIRQGGVLVHEATVAPGPFEINDLYPTGYGGNLEVTVIEASGRRREYTVPYAAVPQLLRPGLSRYALTGGQLRHFGLATPAAWVGEATYQRGLNNKVTAYAGVQAAAQGRYHSVLAGAAINTPLGAVSLDMTRSQARLGHGASQAGQSFRVAYAKSLPDSGTNLSLAAYRYSSEGFLGLAEAMRELERHAQPQWATFQRQRSRFQVTLTQSLRRNDTLVLTGSSSDYWHGAARQTAYHLGYSTRVKTATISFDASRSRDARGREDDVYSLMVNLPLGIAGGRAPMLQVSADRRADGTAVRATINGGRDAFSYGGSASRGQQGNSTLSANASYRSPYGVLGGAYTLGDRSRQASFNASGGLVAHAGGITLAQSLGDTIGLIEAAGARHAGVTGGGRVDRRGFAVTGGLSPYRYNGIRLDPKGTSMDVELQSTHQDVAPRAGAVVAIRYETVTGRAAVVALERDDGQPVPFGAQIFDADGNAVGVVGQAGRAFVRGVADAGALRVRWGVSPMEQCWLDYTFAAPVAPKALPTVQASCRVGPAPTGPGDAREFVHGRRKAGAH